MQRNVVMLAFDFGSHLRPCTAADTGLPLGDPYIGSCSGRG
jgi:hypothetical protein